MDETAVSGVREPLLAHVWLFPARVRRVIDGDTVDAVIDQGMHANRLERLRLLNVNAPEVRGETRVAGLAATQFVRDWLAAIPEGEWPLLVQTYKSDVFGRYLAVIWRRDTAASLNEDLAAWLGTRSPST